MLNKISSQQAHDIIQKAAQAGWHPSHMKNGINLDKSIHNGYDTAHRIYSENLATHLDNHIGQFTSSKAAKDFLVDLQNSIRTQLNNGSTLAQIIF